MWKTLIDHIKCSLGYHDWYYDLEQYDDYFHRSCTRCHTWNQYTATNWGWYPCEMRYQEESE